MKTKSFSCLKIFLLLTLSAIFFSFSFPSFISYRGFGFLAWFCLVPLFLVIDKIKFKFSFLAGIFYGAMSYGFLVYWLNNYSFWLFFLILVLYAVLYGILFIFLKGINLVYGFKGWPVQCLVYLVFEFLKTKGFLGFSYGVLGYTQWKFIPLIQISRFTGVYGISALVVFSSGIIFYLVNVILLRMDVRKRLRFESHNTDFTPVKFEIELSEIKRKAGFKMFFISCFIFLSVYSAILLYGFSNSNVLTASENKKVCAVQHNENPLISGVNIYADNISRLCSLTDEALSLYPDIDIVVWPETSVTPSILYQYENGKDPARITIVKNLLQYIDSKKCDFVIGNFHLVKNESEETFDYNSALLFHPGKNVIPPSPDFYNKMHLVPLSEDFPFEKKFSFLKKYLETKGASFWCKGDIYKVFESGNFKFSTPICFEDTFPDLCRRFCLEGAVGFVNLTNDAWALSSAAQYQHLSMAVFRSVENQVPSVRSATSGQTCIIQNNGSISKMAGSFCPSFAVSEIPILSSNYKTFYTQNGDIYTYLVICITVVLLIIGGIKGIINLWQNR